jgi:hypothetical protein
VGKRKGRQRDTAFTLFSDDEFMEDFYNRRQTFAAALRLRVEADALERDRRPLVPHVRQ